jgi:hypothetical protein
MGLFDIFKKKSAPEKEIVPLPVVSNPAPVVSDPAPPAKNLPQPVLVHPSFSIHEDIKNLLWFGDGPRKNLSEDDMLKDKTVYTIGEIMRVTVGLRLDEPSLIYTALPVKQPQDESVISRPPYYPKYKDLTPEQRWIYLKLLSNPYNTDIDIGYVFILYYGLERHLLQGDFDSAFHVILKLRDVHKNKSFQSYSGNAIVLSSLLKDKGEYVAAFIKSLDKEYEFNFSDNLFLISYYSFDIPLSPKDIMRMAKTFEFTNNNYIKKNPDIFENYLKEVVLAKTGSDKLSLKKYVSASELKKIKYGDTVIYANGSIMGNTVPVPLLADNFKLKKEINLLLEEAHELTKATLAEKRKSETQKSQGIKKTVQPKEKTLNDPQDIELAELYDTYADQ